MVVGLQFRYAVFLMLYVFNTTILCQYKGCCSFHGAAIYFYGQLTSVAVALIIVGILSEIKPWYASCSWRFPKVPACSVLPC